MARSVINPDPLPKPMGPYSQCTAGLGARMIFVSGHVALDVDGALVGRGDIYLQTRQVLANVRAAVEDIRKITVFVTEIGAEACAAVGRARREFFKGAYPASTLVQVKALASADWLVEIEAYAVA